MRPEQLRAARKSAGWTQHKAAIQLGVSQPYYSQIESGARTIPAELLLTAWRELRLSPTVFPLPPLAVEVDPIPPDELAASLAWLGYSGFAPVRKVRLVNPAELAARALVHEDLEPRLVEALPWLLAAFPDLDWSWLIAQCRAVNRQNHLGFLVTLARELEKQDPHEGLRTALAHIEESRLAAESTLCRASMPEAERKWIRKHRPLAAIHWNLLTTLTVEQLSYGR